MCLILFAYKFHPRYPFLFAANRDEFYDRPTAPAAFWEEAPDILAGRDLRCGGTWFGVSRKGKIAVLANHREMEKARPDSPSRGFLVRDFLMDDNTADKYLEKLKRTGDIYNGFSLVFGDFRRLYYYSNKTDAGCVISEGIHGQSNHLLDTPWPKVEGGKEALRRILSSGLEPSVEELFALLADKTRAADNLLPDTGVGIENERILSSIFVNGPSYGTRSSTLVMVDRENNLTFIERTYNGNPDHYTTVEHRFKIQP
jgi:uncharacterized protein with NRDE domain